MTEQLTQAQRDDFIDESRRRTLESLQIPEVQRRLGGYAGELYELASSIIPVDMVGRSVRINERYPRGIPVATLRRGEEALRLASVEPFDGYQLKTLRKQYGYSGMKEWRRLHKDEFKEGTASDLPVFHEALAYVHSDPLEIKGKMHTAVVRGRPLVTLNYDKTNGLPMAGPPTLKHELWHAKQRREMPVWDSSEIDFKAQDIKEELEAYAIGAASILGIRDANQAGVFLHSTPTESIERTLEIDAIRRHVNRYETDPFAGTAKIARELIREGHGITPFLKAKIDEKNS